jgi:precorrin-8X/cobalt-precorrin-8 methylmutase
MTNFLTDPATIEAKSMRLIEAELGLKVSSFSPAELAIVKRVIHATADFEYADLLHFSGGVIDAGLASFKRGGAVIVADTNMIVSGISKVLLEKFSARVFCHVGDSKTAKLAAELGLTRSMVNIHRAVEDHPQAIFAIGNAPTALYELLRMVEEGKASPAMVIGVPVGFVEAAESKEALLQTKLPQILVRGRKGGSTVAVAIVNALLKLA